MSLFFAFAYLSHGISCAQFGIMAQPIQFFMMKGLELSAAAMSSYMALIMLPWMWKPLIGLVIDFLPIFGYRRKSYLVLSNIVAALAFAVMLFNNTHLPTMIGSLFVTALAMSISTVLLVGVAVEEGRKDGKTAHYFRIQEVFYYGANIVTAVCSGLICQHFLPDSAMKTAEIIAIVPLVLMAGLSLKMIKEEKSQLDLSGVKSTAVSFREAARSPFLWVAAAFSFLWNFMPNFGVPLYVYESKVLEFSQASIGQLAAWNSVGMLMAALLHKRVMDKMSAKGQLVFTSIFLSASTLSYLGLRSVESAVLLEIVRGMANMFGILAVYCFAAEYCPRRIEVSVMALLVALRNIATNSAVFVGGQLFTFVFPNNYSALVCIASIAPLLALPFILNLNLKSQTEAL